MFNTICGRTISSNIVHNTDNNFKCLIGKRIVIIIIDHAPKKKKKSTMSLLISCSITVLSMATCITKELHSSKTTNFLK